MSKVDKDSRNSLRLRDKNKKINTLINNNFKNYNYEEEFYFGKVSAHEHVCRSFSFVRIL